MVYFWDPLRNLFLGFMPYARWRESYLTEFPEKRLFPWLEGGLRQVSETWEEAVEEAGPVIELGPKGEEIKKKGIATLVAIGIVLALVSSSE